ncbi:MAG: ligase-associated DNA damage response exonuclease [Paracoccaceae bacterium]
MARAPLLTFTAQGIYCPIGDFHIDPHRPVARALITHGHSDHARPGHAAYLCTTSAAPVIRHRLGKITLNTIAYAEPRDINGVTVSFHPAGHVPGSAQIRVEHRGEVWVVSGDYKTEPDGLSEAFAPVACNTFITECTFGLPVFQWAPQATLAAQINHWWATNAAMGRTSLIAAYSLGKAQRLMVLLNASIGPLLTHASVEATTQILRDQGYPLPPTTQITPQITAKTHPGALIIAPPSALTPDWIHRFAPLDPAFASGWMALKKRQTPGTTGFVLSDHADWSGLNTAIRETGATRVFATHGYTEPFRHWLQDQGYNAAIVECAAPPP